MMKKEIVKVLNDLLNYEDIYACMLIRRGMDGIMPDEKLRNDVVDIWEILQKTIDDIFTIIEQYSEHDLGEINFRMMDYEVMFFILPGSDTALVALVRSLANKGIIEIALESARQKIVGLLE